MDYQQLLLGEHPYLIAAGRAPLRYTHRHAELEINYCLSGNFDFLVDQTHICLQPGDFMIVNSMSAHEVWECERDSARILCLNVGSVFLMEHYDLLANISFDSYFPKGSHPALEALFEETAALKKEPSVFTELEAKGNLYKICAYILKNCVKAETDGRNSGNYRNVMNIERALQHIYKHYAEPLTVEKVAASTGYSKSSFCKLFKSITGETFHSALNRIRIRSACALLRDTTLPVEQVAVKVGFADTKTLCRVFKREMGVTPGAYRKEKQ